MTKTTKTSRRALGSRKRRQPQATSSVARATSRRQTKFPPHLSATPDEWRAIKRGEWLNVTHALDQFRYGSAYAPGNRQLWKLSILAEQITEALQGDWISW